MVFKREEDFESLYANNVLAESSVWDLKVIFGILDQSVQPNQVVQHTSINLPWAQVKLLSYWINVQIAAHELANGKITIPQTLIPADPRTFVPEAPIPPMESQLKERLGQIWEAFTNSL